MDPIDFTTLAFIPSFIVFIILMNMVFFKPVKKVLAERDTVLDSDKNRTKDAILQAESKVEHYEEALAEARHKASEILSKSNEEAHRKKQELVMANSDELRAKKHSASETLESEKDKAISNLSSTIREITALMVGKILHQEIDINLSDEKIKDAFAKKSQNKVEVGV